MCNTVASLRIFTSLIQPYVLFDEANALIQAGQHGDEGLSSDRQGGRAQPSTHPLQLIKVGEFDAQTFSNIH